MVRTRTHLISRSDWEAVGRVHGEAVGDARPASTMMMAAGLLDPRWHVEIEAEALVPAGSDWPAGTDVPAQNPIVAAIRPVG